ncbi:MAG: GNAT family N-acetyltransferase [Methylobacteriaceae bacterium]|nr:GNAT family N-acetyltransferase [Methylobacteriaceae bacterium]
MPLIVETPNLAELIELWLASWAATYPEIDFNTRREWFAEHLALLRAQGCTIAVARDDAGRLAGFVIFNRVSGWLDQLAVHPDAFGAGIARALMGEAKALAPGFLQLDVNADNSRAVAFYEREGFLRTGEGTNPNSGARTLSMEWRQAPS